MFADRTRLPGLSNEVNLEQFFYCKKFQSINEFKHMIIDL